MRVYIGVTVTDGVIDADVFLNRKGALDLIRTEMSTILHREVEEAELADGWDDGELAEELTGPPSFDAALFEVDLTN